MAYERERLIHGADDLDTMVRDVGFLPFMFCGIEGFSLQEHTPSDRWFVKDVEGPWEWRETIAERGEIAYGKLLGKNAGFVSPDFYPDFVNYRRGGLDFDERYEAGQATRNEKRLMELLDTRGPMLSSELKALSGIIKGFDTAITSLQMRTYIVVLRMEYKRDAFGRAYGWGVARYARSETVFGADSVCSRYGVTPETSYRRLSGHLSGLFPEATDRQIRAVLR